MKFVKTYLIGTANCPRWNTITGKFDERNVNVYVKAVYVNNKLSFQGVEGPFSNGNCAGSCGQIILGFREYDQRGSKNLTDIRPADGWDTDKIKQLFDVWSLWHLNTMQPGTPNQMAYLRANPPVSCIDHYEASCKALDAVGLLNDEGYHYGDKWLSKDVPADVLDFLKSLPDSPLYPPWC